MVSMAGTKQPVATDWITVKDALTKRGKESLIKEVVIGNGAERV